MVARLPPAVSALASAGFAAAAVPAAAPQGPCLSRIPATLPYALRRSAVRRPCSRGGSHAPSPVLLLHRDGLTSQPAAGPTRDSIVMLMYHKLDIIICVINKYK